MINAIWTSPFIIRCFNFLIVSSAKIQFPSVFTFPALRALWLFLVSVPLPSSVNTEASKALGVWWCLPLLQIHCSYRILLLQPWETVCYRAIHWLQPDIQRVKLIFSHQPESLALCWGKKMYHLTSGPCLDRISVQEQSFGIEKFVSICALQFIFKYFEI